jgi:hypothetical protein
MTIEKSVDGIRGTFLEKYFKNITGAGLTAETRFDKSAVDRKLFL